jgi:DNA repair protein RecO (recombination protein O)
MAHHIYTTDGFVVESTPSGEADRFYTLFTKELGLIRATARGVRLQKSKLRYSLQDFSWSRISLVRGKELWRITSARAEESLAVKYRDQKPILQTIAHIASLIRRLVGGEEKNEALYKIIDQAFEFLETRTWHTELKLFEIIVVLKILHNLGYLRDIAELHHFIHDPFDESMLEAIKPHKALALKEINTSLRETQL